MVLSLATNDKSMLLLINVDLQSGAVFLLMGNKRLQFSGTCDGSFLLTTDNNIVLIGGWWWDINGDNSEFLLQRINIAIMSTSNERMNPGFSFDNFTMFTTLFSRDLFNFTLSSIHSLLGTSNSNETILFVSLGNRDLSASLILNTLQNLGTFSKDKSMMFLWNVNINRTLLSQIVQDLLLSFSNSGCFSRNNDTNGSIFTLGIFNVGLSFVHNLQAFGLTTVASSAFSEFGGSSRTESSLFKRNLEGGRCC